MTTLLDRLFYVVQHKRIETIEALLKTAQIDINAKNSENKTLLYWAVRRGDLKVIQLLLRYGADVNAHVGWHQWSPLHEASSSFSARRDKVAELLLNHGASIDIENVDGNTPLIIAIIFQELKIVELLLERGANVNHRNRESKTPLHYAAEKYDLTIVNNLIQHGGDLNAHMITGQTPLQLSIDCFNKHITRLLIAHIMLRKDLGLEVVAEDIENLTGRELEMKIQCEEEIRQLKDEYIMADSGMTYYDFITVDIQRATMCLRSLSRLQELRERKMTRRFLFYGEIISYRVRICVDKLQLFCKAHDLLRAILSNVCVLPYDCTLNIFKYFSDKDKREFLETFDED